MSRPLLRGPSGGGPRLNGGGAGKWLDYKRSFDYGSQEKDLEKKDFENGQGPETRSPVSAAAAAAASRSRKSTVFFAVKLCIVLVMALAILGSLYWTISISMTSRGKIHKSYRRLQEQLVADFSEIGGLSLGAAKSKELEFCPPELENFVPCYNASEKSDSEESTYSPVEFERRCPRESSEEQGCVVPPPRDYRIPLRWPTGRDFIWKDNVKITGEEFALGSLTKR